VFGATVDVAMGLRPEQVLSLYRAASRLDPLAHRIVRCIDANLAANDLVDIEIMAGNNFSAIIFVHLFEQLPFTSRIAAFFSSELIATRIRAVVKN